MKCNYYQQRKHILPDYRMRELLQEYLATNPKIQEAKIKEYIRANSWDEEDFNKKYQHYKDTGELPEKI